MHRRDLDPQILKNLDDLDLNLVIYLFIFDMFSREKKIFSQDISIRVREKN
jgi:hypothetical protein